MISVKDYLNTHKLNKWKLVVKEEWKKKKAKKKKKETNENITITTLEELNR